MLSMEQRKRINEDFCITEDFCIMEQKTMLLQVVPSGPPELSLSSGIFLLKTAVSAKRIVHLDFLQ